MWCLSTLRVFTIGMGIAQVYGIKLHLLQVSIVNLKRSSGVAKHSVAYPTPGGPETPEQELTTLGPEQRLVELVSNRALFKTIRLLDWKLYWVTWVLMIPANGFIKPSALFFYRRIFIVNKGSAFDITIQVSIIICALWTISFFIATLLGCGVHFDYPWASLLKISECNTDTRLDGMMISDLITDIIVWLLPIPAVSHIWLL